MEYSIWMKGHKQQDMYLLEQVQRRVTRMTKGLEYASSVQREAERVGVTEPEEETSLGRPYGCFSQHKSLQRS